MNSRPAVALDDAAHRAPALQPGHLEADLGAGPGAADQDAGAEPAQAVDGEPEHLGHGRCLQREMRAAAGDAADLRQRLRALAFERMRPPNSRARASRAGSRSTAMIGSQPAILPAISPASLTPPTPKTTSDCPGCGHITLSTAPAPVCKPQPSGPSISTGASRRIFTTSFAGATAKVAKEDC